MNHRTNIPQDIEYFPVEQIVNLLRVVAAERDELFVALQQQQQQQQQIDNISGDQAASKTIAGVATAAVTPAFPANDAFGFPYPAAAVAAETVDHYQYQQQQQQHLHHHQQQQHQHQNPPSHIPTMNPHHQFQHQHHQHHYHQPTNNNMVHNNHNNNQNAIHVNLGGTNNDNNNPTVHVTMNMDNNMHQHQPTNNFGGNFGGTITNNNTNVSPNHMIPNQNHQNHHSMHNNNSNNYHQNQQNNNNNNPNSTIIPPSFKVETVKKRIAKKSYTLVKKTPHSKTKKPFTEIHEAVPNAACAMALFAGFAPKSDTSRLTRWDLDGNQVLEWFNKQHPSNANSSHVSSGGTTTTNGNKLAPKYIHPVKFDGKIFFFGGSPLAKGKAKPVVYAWARYISLQAKYDKKGGSLQLKFRTVMVGSGRPTEAKPDSPPSLEI